MGVAQAVALAPAPIAEFRGAIRNRAEDGPAR